ncbi:MAG: hypothetical protein ACRD8A_06820 [Candidatus Acidiferrales bacterium]
MRLKTLQNRGGTTEMRIFLIPVLLGTMLLSCIGCGEPVTWSSESRSPDGRWIAKAQTIVYSGFGTGTVETTVEIKRSNGSGSAEQVLGFAQAGSDMDLKMRWDSPSHLVVRYKANPALLYFEVVKTSGVTISVQNVSANPQQEFRPSAQP